MSSPALERLRRICLARPGAVEDRQGVGNPSFKVGGKIFALHTLDHHGDGREAVWCKAPVGAQAALTGSDPDHYFVPPYVGRYGWVGVWLDGQVDWVEVQGLVEDSFNMTAPRRSHPGVGTKG
ncbi:MAG: MmcQ/YjbR family DNA-binding protein [Candidatus Dormibacteria bacterium]